MTYSQLLSAVSRAYRGKGLYAGLTELLYRTLPQAGVGNSRPVELLKKTPKGIFFKLNEIAKLKDACTPIKKNLSLSVW